MLWSALSTATVATATGILLRNRSLRNKDTEGAAATPEGESSPPSLRQVRSVPVTPRQDIEEPSVQGPKEGAVISCKQTAGRFCSSELTEAVEGAHKEVQSARPCHTSVPPSDSAPGSPQHPCSASAVQPPPGLSACGQEPSRDNTAEIDQGLHGDPPARNAGLNTNDGLRSSAERATSTLPTGHCTAEGVTNLETVSPPSPAQKSSSNSPASAGRAHHRERLHATMSQMETASNALEGAAAALTEAHARQGSLPAMSSPNGSAGGSTAAAGASDPALLGVQDKIIKLTREQAAERQQELNRLKEEQRRLAAIRKEITETERANADLKKSLGHTDLKKLKEQKEALAAQATEAEHLAAQVSALGSSANRLSALRAERARLEPLAGEVAALEEQLKELRQIEATKNALQAEVAGLQPAAVVTERLRKQVVTLRADAAAAESLQEMVSSLSPVAEQLPNLKALYAKLQASAAEVRQLEKQLEQRDKMEALRVQLQGQLEEFQAKVAGIESLKRRVEAAQLAAGEVTQLEARFAALQSVAARLPVLRTQHERLVAQCAEVADLELQLGELKQQVALRNALQQQVNILAPKAAGAESLRAALRDMEAQVAASEELERQLAAMRAAAAERRREGATQFSEAVSNLGLVHAASEQLYQVMAEEGAGGEEGGTGEEGSMTERSMSGYVPSGGLTLRPNPVPSFRSTSVAPAGSMARDTSQFSEAVSSLGLERTRGASMAPAQSSSFSSGGVNVGPSGSELPKLTPRISMSAAGSGPGAAIIAAALAAGGPQPHAVALEQQTALLEARAADLEQQQRQRLLELEAQVRSQAEEAYGREAAQLRARLRELVATPPADVSALRAEVASLESAAAEGLELQKQVAEMRLLASQRSELQKGVQDSLQSQLMLLEEQAREAEALERQVQAKSDVVARKHELELQLTELEATAAEIYLLDQLVAGRKDSISRRPLLDAEMARLQPEADEAERVREAVEALAAMAAQLPDLELRRNELKTAADDVAAARAEIAALEAVVSERPALEARLADLRAQLPDMRALEEQLAQAQDLAGRQAELASELAKVAGPAAEAQALLTRLEELRLLVANAPQLEADIEEAEMEVARVRTLEMIVGQLRTEIAQGPVLREELNGLNNTAEALQHAEEYSLRAERDTARARVAELEGALAEVEAQLDQSRSGTASMGGSLDEEPAGTEGEDEEGVLADMQARLARRQQLIDNRHALQQELKELQVVEVEVASLRAAIRALAPLAEQRAALASELEALQRGAGAAATALTSMQHTAPAPPAPSPVHHAPHAPSNGSSGRASFEGPLGRGAAAGLPSTAFTPTAAPLSRAKQASSGGGVGGGRLEPEAPLPVDAAALAALEPDAIAALAQQRGALAAEVESLRAAVADVAALREERDALRAVEAEVLALSNEIPSLAPYAELLPTLRDQHARLVEAVGEAERMRAGCDTLDLQLQVLRALQGEGFGVAAATAAGAEGVPAAGAEEAAPERLAAPAGPVEEAEALASETAAASAAEVATPTKAKAASSGGADVGGASPGSGVGASLTALFAKLRSLETAKQELQGENEELHDTVAHLREQLESSAVAMHKLRGVAEALSTLRRRGAGGV